MAPSPRSDGGWRGSRGLGREGRTSPVLPRFSSADATWLTRAAKRVFVRCTTPYATQRDRGQSAQPAECVRPLPRLGAAPGCATRAGRRPVPLQPLWARRAHRALGSTFSTTSSHRSSLVGASWLWRASWIGRFALGGGYSGDFARVLASLEALNRADVVFSTVDTVGIPLALLGRLGRVKPPVVYAAIGLPERLEQLRGAGRRAALRSGVPTPRHDRGLRRGRGGRAASVARRGWPESRVRLVRSGYGALPARPGRAAGDDVVSVGADPRRDFALLVELARRLPGAVVSNRRFGRQRPRARGAACERAARGRRAVQPCARVASSQARVVALPVRENTYSGATTTLLQAMACGKPVVVTRTAAIARGYHLEDGVNCRLVPPEISSLSSRAS